MIKCPNCNKELDAQDMFDNSKIEFVFEDSIGLSYECPQCGHKVLFESAPAFYYNGRRFLEFKKTKED